MKWLGLAARGGGGKNGRGKGGKGGFCTRVAWLLGWDEVR